MSRKEANELIERLITLKNEEELSRTSIATINEACNALEGIAYENK